MNIKVIALMAIALLSTSCGGNLNSAGGYGPIMRLTAGYYTATTSCHKRDFDTKYEQYGEKFDGKVFVADHPSKAPSDCFVIPRIREHTLNDSGGKPSGHGPIAYWISGCTFGMDYSWYQLIGETWGLVDGEWYGESSDGERVMLSICNTGTAEKGASLSMTFREVRDQFKLGEKTENGYKYSDPVDSSQKRWFTVNIHDIVPAN